MVVKGFVCEQDFKFLKSGKYDLFIVSLSAFNGTCWIRDVLSEPGKNPCTRSSAMLCDRMFLILKDVMFFKGLERDDLDHCGVLCTNMFLL